VNDVARCIQDAGLQPFPDQPQQSPVIDPHTPHGLEPGMVQVVNEAWLFAKFEASG
jgi:hypothetical protein